MSVPYITPYKANPTSDKATAATVQGCDLRFAHNNEHIMATLIHHLLHLSQHAGRHPATTNNGQMSPSTAFSTLPESLPLGNILGVIVSQQTSGRRFSGRNGMLTLARSRIKACEAPPMMPQPTEPRELRGAGQAPDWPSSRWGCETV